MLLPYIYYAYACLTWGCDIVRKRKGEKRCGRQSLERSLEPLEPIEPLEQIEPIEPILWRTTLQAEV